LTSVFVVHDGARPLVTPATIAGAIEMLERDDGCAGVVVGHPSYDTLKQVDDLDVVVATPDRATIWSAQTPQVFRAQTLRDAYERAAHTGWTGTDDASFVEHAGGRVRVFAGPRDNVKITVPEDLRVAEALLQAREGRAGMDSLRVGTGYDVHAFTDGRALVLGGVTIPYERGLAGHSDADVLVHALMDAIVGALREGDIGRLFPDTDPRYSGASSVGLLREVAALMRERGFRLVDADTVLVLEEPRIAPYRESMRMEIARALDVDVERVGVKATTTEGLGFAGRKEGVAVHAVALLERCRA
ncbi:MAG TPA: 2-C-methyl-D-erythritol 2,4-cyclodiphosphate synthase, partial [Actinobacteria bacterium]|nr:2-C-methyl-D-erythritol 2,4-cyclodiphosphate synthase [Actinomycetota bacterium]